MPKVVPLIPKRTLHATVQARADARPIAECAGQDRDLEYVVEAWPYLGERTKGRILGMVDGRAGRRDEPSPAAETVVTESPEPGRIGEYRG